MTTIQEFNDETITRFELWLENAAEQENKKYYEAYVDGMKVIFKTDNTKKLEDLQSWIEPTSKVVKIYVYNSVGTHRYVVFEFRTPKYMEQLETERQIKELQQTQNQHPLNGIEDINAKINEAIIRERERQELASLKQKNADLETELDNAMQLIERQSLFIKTLESKDKTYLNDLIKMAKPYADAFIFSNPKFKEYATGLSGVYEREQAQAQAANSTSGENAQAEPTVTFRRVKNDGDEEQESELSEGQTMILAIFEKAEENMTIEQFRQYVALVEMLAENPKYLTSLMQYINSQSNQGVKSNTAKHTPDQSQKTNVGGVQTNTSSKEEDSDDDSSQSPNLPVNM